MSKYVFIEKAGRTTEEIARDFEKAFYKKATLHQIGKRVFLQSYDTIVAYIANGKLFKLWDGYSVTTSRHIQAFCYTYGVKGPSKKEWENMPYKRINKPYKKDNEYKASYFNIYSSRSYY